jgi:hypothetical protein
MAEGFKTYDRDYQRHQPLKYRYGDEKAKTVVVGASTVALDSDDRRLVARGELLVEITSGHLDGKYGPYLKTASDGRQSLSRDAAVIATQGLELTLGIDRVLAGWFADCVFDLSEMTLNGVSDSSSGQANLRTAFPQCTFDD